MTTIIIGAGVAGIAAASQLDDYIVIEPREYIGGRLRTIREPFGPIELGAGWFHETQENAAASVNPLIKIAKDSGIETEFDDQNIQIYSLNGPIEPSALGEIPAKWQEFRSSKPETSIEMLGNVFSDTQGTDKTIARDFAFSQTLGQGLAISQGSTKYGNLDGRDQVAINGYDQLLEPLLKQVDLSKIKLGEQVKEVEWTAEGGVKVITSKGTYTGKNVIVTAPLAILKAGDIKFSPSLPVHINSAIDLGSVAVLGKVYVEFPARFWDTSVDKTLVVGKDPALVYNWCKEHSSDRNVVSVLCIADTCRAAESAKTPQEAFSHVKKFFDAVNISGKPTPEPLFVQTSKWSQDPFAKGSFSTFKFGDNRQDAVKIFEEGACPIFFAGEHTSMTGATFLHGAYLSGLRAAKQAKL